MLLEKLTNRQKESLITDYGKKGNSMAKLGEKYNYSWGSIRKFFLLNKVKLKSRSDAIRKNFLNENSFSFPLNKESAYWAGFLIADGCVNYLHNGSLRLRIALSKKDISHLKKLKLFLEADYEIFLSSNGHKLGKYKFKPTYCLEITSNNLCKDLINLGATTKKSFNAKANSILIDNVNFWRGVIDGDGNIGIYKVYKKYKYPHIGLCGSKSLIKQFNEYVFKNFNIKNKILKDNKIYTISYKGKGASKIINHIYSDSPFLNRKQKIANIIRRKCD